MTGIKLVNLKLLIEEIGENEAKSYLSNFTCPLNADVENFIKRKAIEFAKQGLSQTHLVMMPYKKNLVMVGYFTLANKYITVSAKKLNNNLKRRISKFSIYDSRIKAYCLSAPLIAQVGKNYANGYNNLISGDELLELACRKIKGIQFELGGRFAYLECEDKPKLIEFYRKNGFYEFDSRYLDHDEVDLEGTRLIQFIKYMKS
jgi:hypothetical protein